LKLDIIPEPRLPNITIRMEILSY